MEPTPSKELPDGGSSSDWKQAAQEWLHNQWTHYSLIAVLIADLLVLFANLAVTFTHFGVEGTEDAATKYQIKRVLVYVSLGFGAFSVVRILLITVIESATRPWRKPTYLLEVAFVLLSLVADYWDLGFINQKESVPLFEVACLILAFCKVGLAFYEFCMIQVRKLKEDVQAINLFATAMKFEMNLMGSRLSSRMTALESRVSALEQAADESSEPLASSPANSVN